MAIVTRWKMRRRKKIKGLFKKIKIKKMSPYHKLSLGEKAPEVINVVVEIPKGSHNKYEFDEELGVFKLDRVFYSAVHFPTDYGYIPETRSEDGDHLDALVIGSDPTFPGCLVEARPVALIHMVDSGEQDNKILAVQARNPRLQEIKDLKDLETFNPHFLKEVKQFFETYKILQGKEVKITGIENAAAAKAEIERARKMYTDGN